MVRFNSMSKIASFSIIVLVLIIRSGSLPGEVGS